MDYMLTEHAENMIARARSKTELINSTLDAPALVLPHECDSALRYAFEQIPDYGNRVFRVIHNADEKPVVIVTVYFDRTMKGTL